MTKPYNRAYKFSDAELKQKADAIALSMQRDAAKFADRGVTTSMIADFETVSNDFGETDSDEIWIGELLGAVQDKDALRTELVATITTIRNMGKIKWGARHVKFLAFGFGSISRASDNKLVRIARRILLVATQQQTELATEGLTATTLTTFTTVLTQFDLSIDTKITTKIDRDIAQQQRVGTGNHLYTLLEKYCSIGRSIWANDAARYNDYLINPPTAATKVATKDE